MDDRNFGNVPLLRKADDESCDSVTKSLQRFVEDRHGIKFNGYWELHKWTVEHVADFWAALWDFCGVIYSEPYDQVIDPNATFSDIPVWFKGAKMNYAENLLKYRDDKVAIVSLGEDRGIKAFSFAEMYEQARLYAAAFRKCGLKKGDIVVCFMTNRAEPVFAMEAVVSVGAIWSGALPLIGPQAALNRFQQVKPKFLLTIDRFRYDGQEMDMISKLKIISKGLPSVEKFIIVPSKGITVLPDIGDIENGCFLHEFLELGREEDGSIPPMQFEQVSFSHPVCINYTSGTTGLPKPIIHGCGVIMAVVKDFHINFNSRRGDIWLSISAVGWASWNMFSTLYFLGETTVLFEGLPYFLSPTYFFDMLEELKITHIFLPASILDEFRKRKYVPTKPLSSLKYLLSGGSVVKPQNHSFVYEHVKNDIVCSSSYGCTEIMGMCVEAESSLTIHRGEIPAMCLGYDVETVDEKGNRVVGEVGEVVLAKPVPALCNGIWGDADGSIFREKYFSKYPGKFLVGDYAIINPITRGWIICGRSDDTLKQRGCRFGSTEIYNVVDQFPEVRDSICVSKYNEEMDESAVLFLKMCDGQRFSVELERKIRSAIARELTVRHVPDVILETKDIPYNVTGKKLEVLVKNIINNKPYNADTAINPESLKFFKNVPQLHTK